MRTNNTLRGKTLLNEFYNFTRNYVQYTRSNVQRSLGEGRLAGEIILLNDLIRSLSNLHCQTSSQLHQIQKALLQNFQDIVTNILFPNKRGIVANILGDAIILNSCRRVKKYKIIWNQKINNTCYHLFPIYVEYSNQTKYFELQTHHILNISHTIPCELRPQETFIRDMYGKFWKYNLPNSFSKVKVHAYRHQKFHISLPILGTYSNKLLHYKQNIPHRITLLSLLSQQRENLQSLTEIRTNGGGSFFLGLTKSIAYTINSLEKTGESIFNTIVNGVDRSITVLANSTSQVISSTSKGISSILEQIGIPNFILYIINALIITYLVLMRCQNQRLAFLFPKHKCNRVIGSLTENDPPPIPLRHRNMVTQPQ